MQVISEEAKRLDAAMMASSVAFSYFDTSDRLQLWNKAYEALNFRIADLVHKGAAFADMLAELVARGQVTIKGEAPAWIDARLRARQLGRTAFRRLADGRVFLVQERKDEVGGTLGFWFDVSDLFRSGALQNAAFPITGASNGLSEPGYQELIRSQLQTIVGTLELVRLNTDSENHPFLADARMAVDTIHACLDVLREEAG